MLTLFCFMILFILLFLLYTKVRELELQVRELEKHQTTDAEKQPVSLPIRNESFPDLPVDDKPKLVEQELKKPDHLEQIDEKAGGVAKEKQEKEERETGNTPVMPPITKRKSRTRTEWELLIGGKWLNWIGAVAIFLGVAFFMKYAFDHNWINEAMRVAIGGLFGGVLVFVGGRFAKKGLSIFSQGLVGAGTAVLYAAVFASYNFYHLIPQLAAMISMLFITVLAFQQALRYQSLATAILGWIGAYATPFVLPGEGSTIGLMSYLSLVTIGMLALVWKKQTWMVLYYLTFAATYVIYFSWSFVIPDKETSVLYPFLILFWVLFYVFDLRFLFRTELNQAERVVGVGNTILFTFGLLYLTYLWIPDAKWIASGLVLLIGLFYLAPIVYYHRRGLLDKTNQWQLARQAISFLVLIIYATALGFRLPVSFLVASIEAVIVVWWGLRYQVRYVALFGLGFIGLVSWSSLLYTMVHDNQGQPLMNWNFWNLVFSSLGLFWSAHLFGQKGHKQIRSSLHIAWSCLLLINLVMETKYVSSFYFPRDYIPPITISPVNANYLTDLSIIALCLVYALVLTWFAFRRKVHLLHYISTGILVLTLLGLISKGNSYQAITHFTPVLNARAALFLLAIGLVFWFQQMWRVQGNQHAWQKWIRLTSIITIVILLFEVVTAEISDGFTYLMLQLAPSQGDHANLLRLENSKEYTLLLVWVFGSIPMYLYGVRLRFRFLMQLGLFTLGIGALPILIKGLSYYSLAAFLPVLNGRFFSLICVLAVVVFYLRIVKAEEKSTYVRIVRQALFFLGVIATFVLVTMEVSDGFERVIAFSHHDSQIMRLANLQQLSISIAWLLLSSLFLWIGIWQKKQSIRIISICIFGLAILKIFLFDLSFLTTLYRIFSFMGLGVILLGVSFVYQRYKHWFSG